MTNKTVLWEPFSTTIIQQVWEKGQIVPGHDPNLIRRDKCGALIHRKLFGANTKALSMAWEIDHIQPIAKGGKDELINLQPLQWENNRNKSDAYPKWDCYVSSKDDENVYR